MVRTGIARWVKRSASVLVVCSVAFACVTALRPLPETLRGPSLYEASVRMLDREGGTLAEVRASDGARARWLSIDDTPRDMVMAILAAEDARFFEHRGVDPLAIVRALTQNLRSGRIVSGASTLTQQLARVVEPQRRTLWGKLQQASLALRIEASLSKRQILEQYLNRVAFGPNIRGVSAASHYLFDKDVGALSLSEMALLVALPRGPSLYDPRRGPALATRRRDRILSRMQARHWIDEERLARAVREPVALHVAATGFESPHLVRAILRGAVEPSLGPLTGRVSVVETTLQRRLQREAQAAAREQIAALSSQVATASSVIVLDNATGEVLAWVGSQSFSDDAHLGQNDGVIALRSPGSALKPFVYSAAIDLLGWTPATILPDVELHLGAEIGDYSPRNYDGKFHGPVRLREALANSYNIPAVFTADAVGPARVLERLHAFGFTGLDRDPEDYGAAIALGDGEVRLVDLANAYATLARGGTWRALRIVRRAELTGGSVIAPAPAADARVVPETTAALVTDILSDRHARLAAFGAGNALEFPFEVACKTGTSKGFRDNIAVGFTHEVTVAVWVGNFDGSPMHEVSGVTGAGPLLHTVMLAAMRDRAAAPLVSRGVPFDEVQICPLSGKRAGAACPHRIPERFVPGTAPNATCDNHEATDIDTRNGLLATPLCPRRSVESRVFEHFDSAFTSWAMSAHRPLLPTRVSSLCASEPTATADRVSQAGALRIRYPYPGAVFLRDPSRRASSEGIVVRVDVPETTGHVQFLVDGARVADVGPPFEQPLLFADLAPGEHRVSVRAGEGRGSDSVAFTLR